MTNNETIRQTEDQTGKKPAEKIDRLDQQTGR